VDSEIEPRAFVEPIRTTRTFETAIEHLVDGIEQSRIQRGERLPSEIELSRQLNISRPTLRQALRIPTTSTSDEAFSC
jgi:DNA-binding FadR family transcriptional regulator